MDDAEFQRLLAATLPPQPKAPPAAEAAPAAPEAAAPQPQQPTTLQDVVPGAPATTGAVMVGPGEPATMDPLTNAIDAAGVGAAKSVLATKDFLFGRPPEDEKSSLRQSIESTGEALDNQSPAYGFISGLSQFVTGMIGAGKIVKGLSLVPKLGEAVTAAGDAIEGGGKLARGAAEAAKAAAVGSVVFDPHDPRLSNLIESFPALSNPITRFLMAKPGDSDAEERLKGALESLGLDATLGPILAGGLKVYKALRGGDREAAAKAADEVVTASQDHEAARATPNTTETPNATSSGTPDVPPATAEEPGAGNAAPTSEDVGHEAGAPGNAEEGTGGEGQAEVAPSVETTPEVTAVPNPTSAAAEEGTKLPPKFSPADIPDDTAQAVIKSFSDDADALAKYGSWDDAVANGHVFGRGEGIPWQKLGAADGDGAADLYNAYLGRMVDAIKPQVDAAKGGDVLSDARVQEMVQQRATLWGEDPTALAGLIQRAGKEAHDMAANMEAGFLVTNRAWSDTYALAARIAAGAVDDPGAAIKELQQKMAATSALYSGARSMSASAGRALRRMRFTPDPDILANLEKMDGSQLARLIAGTGGDPGALKHLTNPSWARQAIGWVNFMNANNLLWGWKTHLVNMASNGMVMVMRPAERIAGAEIAKRLGTMDTSAATSLQREAWRQYGYMMTALPDAFRAAKEAFILGDSVLAPHSQRLSVAESRGMPNVGEWAPKPIHGLADLIHNALLVAALPTRALGFADEATKQIVYRSKVMARAAVEGSDLGLVGQDLKDHINRRLSDSFDASGAGIDANAKQEALAATFSQELQQGTLGAGIQNLTNSVPATRLILPFVRTPTNVLRYGWRLTPGLNLLQTEFRNGLLGKMGAEAQAQAIGQMVTGSLLVGSMAALASTGVVTGGGPQSPKLRSQLMATGWQPYSFVIRHEDGTTTYFPYGKFDPIAVPLGIVADIQDLLSHPAEDSGIADAIGGLVLAVSKQLSNKSYLVNISNALDALSGDDNGSAAEKFVGQTVGNLVPGSSLLREVNPDPYLRDARTVIDRVMASVPGLSAHLPPRYDLWGDPITVRRGLWSSVNDSIVDQEYDRMASLGQAPTPPAASLGDGVDLRDITMADGRNAYTAYQELSGRIGGKQDSLKDAAAALIKSPAYQGAPDGPLDVRGTRAWELHGLIMRYRNVAMRIIKADPNVRAKMLDARLKVAGAYASKQADPEGAHAQAQALQKMGERFGVDLSGLTRALPANTGN